LVNHNSILFSILAQMKLERHIQTIYFTLCILISAHISFGQIYSHKSLTHRDGLPLDATWAIKEKNDGGILIGTEGAGIVEYDGYLFKELISQQKDNNHFVTGIELIDNEILFTSKFYGVFKINNKQEVHPIIGRKNNGDFMDITKFNDFLFIITSNTILTYDYKKKTERKAKPISEEGKLQVFQIIKSENECIFLTNKGHYIATKKGDFIPLSTFFNTTSPSLANMTFGYIKNGMLHLFDKNIEKGMLIEMKGNNFNHKEKKINKPITLSDFQIVSSAYNTKRNCFTFFTYRGEILEENNFSVKQLHNNNPLNKITTNKAICDQHGNYWFTTYGLGVFKIGYEPFIKLNLHHEFADRHISYVFKDSEDLIIFSSFNGYTVTGNLYDGAMKYHSLGILTEATIENKTYFGTLTGIYEYIKKSEEFKKVTIKGIDTEKKIQFITYQAPYIWMNIFGEGLYKLDQEFNLITHYKEPSIIYTAQFSSDGKNLYMGTSTGIKQLDITSGLLSTIDNHNLGYYSGLSVKDAFGTNWFTLEKGIIGISKRGEIYTLSDKYLFPSYLFYTLNTDNYGNLVIGTNKGLTFIQTNEKGKAINHRNFTAGEGFGGYETHMRASFQGNNFVLVGTVEGLYFLDFERLQSLPPPNKPVLTYRNNTESPQNLSVKFCSKNPTVKNVRYTYRIIGYEGDKWSDLTEQTGLYVTDIPEGNYTLEVKATYDGVTFSPIATYPIEITFPFLRGNVFVILLSLIVILINTLFYIRWQKASSYELFYSDEFYQTQKYTPTLILFGVISHILANELIPFISTNLKVNHLLVILVGLVLLFFFLKTLRDAKNGEKHKIKRNLSAAFVTILLFNIYSLYETSLHPFYGFSIILISSLASLIFERTKSIIIYAACFIGITIVVILISTGLNYDKYLLIIPIVISGLLSVLVNMINYDSIRQLAFISSIINKSDVLAFAMNKEGKLKYVSKNIEKYINIKPEILIDQPISSLNEFIPKGIAERDIDLTTEFRDGKHFIAPFLNRSEEVLWFEWSCKTFPEELQVIIGQDITERINLKNTYEIIVENAEDLIYQVDTNGNFQFLNNRFNDYLPYDKELLINKNVTEILPDDYKTRIVDHYLNQLKTKEKVSYFEFPFVDANNQTQWFGQYVTLLFSVGNTEKATGFLAVARNITEKIKKDNIIATQRTDITSSINYAKRIQLNLLPSEDKIESFFSESLVIYKPKDIVSGDFYWCNQIEHYTIIAVGDGTGHGVPGAFMSILGFKMLNSIILEKQIHDPGRILDELDYRLKQMFAERNQEQKINDGIEISICVFNEQTKTYEYACAGSRIIIHDGLSFSVRKGDSKHIGDFQKDFQGYITHYGNIEHDTTIYLFTDGFHDQFGGLQNKKYSLRRLLELFTQNISLPLKTQKDIFENELNNWKSDTDQTDDITVVGIRKTKK
jgi:PAS domain S-box-containing protein